MSTIIKSDRNLKFTDVLPVEDMEIHTPTGWKSIKEFYKTIEYEIYEVKLADGKTLKCADKHILIDSEGQEVFVDELEVGEIIATEDDDSPVVEVKSLGYKEECYDLWVDDDIHHYYTNGIVSHNTTTASAYILHQAITRKDITIAILANKEETAKEILDRIKFAYSMMPWYMKPGVLEWNKKSILLANGSKGVRIFIGACSPDSIRGKSCVAGDSKICVSDNDDIYYLKIKEAINMNFRKNHKKRYYIVYKTTNIINNMIYIGVHGCNDLSFDGYLGGGVELRKAIEEFGAENFVRETLYVFDNVYDAQKKEKELVNVSFTASENTYNKRIGGMFYDRANFTPTRSGKHIVHNGVEYSSFRHVYEKTNLSRKKIWLLAGNPDITETYFMNTEDQKKAEEFYIKTIYNHKQNRKKLSELAKERFSGVPKSEEFKKILSKKLKGIKRKNPQNKDPEKIRKTAEKHRGMKRSKETCERISQSLKGKPPTVKGKKCFINPNTKEIRYFYDGEQPNDFIKDNREWWHDPVTKKAYRLFDNESSDGLVKGRPVGKRK